MATEKAEKFDLKTAKIDHRWALERLNYWQSLLRLDDWKLTLVIRRARDMTQESALAETRWSRTLKTASVTLMDPTDWTPDDLVNRRQLSISNDEKAFLYEVDSDIIHELLHLHFTPRKMEEFLRSDKESLDNLEIAINMMASALVDLEYRERKETGK